MRRRSPPRGLAGLLGRSGFEVVGKAGAPSETIELVREVRPDLALVDLRMPPAHTAEGLDAAGAALSAHPAANWSPHGPSSGW